MYKLILYTNQYTRTHENEGEKTFLNSTCKEGSRKSFRLLCSWAISSLIPWPCPLHLNPLPATPVSGTALASRRLWRCPDARHGQEPWVRGDKKPSCMWPYWLWDMTKPRARGRTKSLPLDKRLAGLSLDPVQTAMSVLFPEKPRSFCELMSWAGADPWAKGPPWERGTTPGPTTVCQSPWGQTADNSHKGAAALRILSF